ncbi:hypothetical protein PYCCODRAFT_688801 [Trametes coccinea BRFM310]|uniref:Uncharacterized protein n=1 Tax=Trametes coccinea (strain BRFM310) TaxID=1353009 RepID=A0A1Y2IIR4_TRAC3|nr:hypothetical protein PYCCODRAFT_688801 [Trametes coccinea BRFM310]
MLELASVLSGDLPLPRVLSSPCLSHAPQTSPFDLNLIRCRYTNPRAFQSLRRPATGTSYRVPTPSKFEPLILNLYGEQGSLRAQAFERVDLRKGCLRQRKSGSSSVTLSKQVEARVGPRTNFAVTGSASPPLSSLARTQTRFAGRTNRPTHTTTAISVRPSGPPHGPLSREAHTASDISQPSVCTLPALRSPLPTCRQAPSPRADSCAPRTCSKRLCASHSGAEA